MCKVEIDWNSRIAGNNTDKVCKVYVLEDESWRHLYQSRINMAIQAYTSDDTQEEWENLQKTVQQAANKGVGKKKQFRRRKGLRIWTKEIEESVKYKRESYLSYLDSPTKGNKGEYR